MLLILPQSYLGGYGYLASGSHVESRVVTRDNVGDKEWLDIGDAGVHENQSTNVVEFVPARFEHGITW